MMGLKDKLLDRVVMRKARAEFEKRGDYCEHRGEGKGVCDDCLKVAVGLAKEQAKTLTFSEKIAMLKGAKKDKTE